MRPRLAKCKPPRPRPLQLEVLEDRRLLSGGQPFLDASDHQPPAVGPPPAAVRPADYHEQDVDHPARQDAREDRGDGHGHDDHAHGDGDDHAGGESNPHAPPPPGGQGNGDHGQGGGTDNGHGNGGQPPPVASNPPPSSPGARGRGNVPGTTGGPPPTASGGQTLADGGDTSSQHAGEGNATAAPGTTVTARPGPTTTHTDNDKTTAAPSQHDETAAEQAASLPAPPEVALASVGLTPDENASAGLGGATGSGLTALLGATGIHANLGAFAAYAVGGLVLPLGTEPGNYSVEVGTPEVAENAAGGTTTARLVPLPAPADPGGTAPEAVALDPDPVEAGLLTNVLSPDLPELGNEAGGLLQGVEDMLGRIGTARSAWALGPALAAAVGAAAYVGVRQRRKRRQQAARLGLPAADADSDSWLPGSDSIQRREGP